MTQFGAYDPEVCYMEYVDGNYLFVLPASSCIGSKECTWNIDQGVAPVLDQYLIPNPPNATTATYTCDNQIHDLGWPETDTVLPLNRYVCTCGGAIAPQWANASELKSGCFDRCDRPWQAAFDMKCNVVSQSGNLSIARANFSTGLLSQGTCVTAAGKGAYNSTNDNFGIIDGFGLTQICNNQENGDPSGICNCDGPLPESAWGHKIEVRDPCGLDRHSSKAWIAAPVFGGLAIFFAAIAVFYLLARRSNNSGARTHRQTEGVPLSFMGAFKSKSQRLAGRLTHRPHAGFDASTPSQTSLESGDSGGDLLDHRQTSAV